MDATGEVIAKQRARTVRDFAKSSHALNILAGSDKSNPTKEAVAAVFIARLELGRMSLKDATAQRRTVDLNESQQKAYHEEITNLTVADLYDKARRDRDYSHLGPRFVAMKEASQIPTSTYQRNFWSQLMQHAQKEGNAKLYEESYREYKKSLGDDRRYRRIFARYDEVLAALKNGKEVPQPHRRGDGAGKIDKKRHP